jgi:hypothetical protein
LIPAFSPPRDGADAGFSLSEALVAVFLMALAAMVIVGTLPVRPVAGIAAAERLRHDFEDIRDRAIISGQAQAIRLRTDGYEHLKWENEKWLPASRRAVQLDQNVTIALEKAEPRSRFGTETEQPEIVFDPTGIVVSPNLVLVWEGGNLPLSVMPDGAVMWDNGNV